MNILGRLTLIQPVRWHVCFNISNRYLVRPDSTVDSKRNNYTDLD